MELSRDRARAVNLVTTNLAVHDAIGNDVLGMRESLLDAGFRVETYAADVHPKLANVAKRLDMNTQDFWNDRGALLIYHHSMGWPAGQDLIEASRSRIVVKYHNITPPRFFQQYSDTYAGACRAGEVANFRVANHRGAIFWGDSTYNCEDLARYGAERERCRVLAPFHFIEQAREVPLDREVLAKYKHRPGTKILFVGGIKPNKGHLNLLRVTAEYRRRFDPNVTLFLPGSIDSRLKPYMRHLDDVMETHGIRANVVLPGRVNASQLKSFFFMSDIFLCLSEHEGFCVPLIEAMYHRVPIVAAASTAVPETVGDAGIVWPEDEAAAYSVDTIARCMADNGLADGLRAAGRRRFETEYRREALTRRLLGLVEEAFSGERSSARY